MVALVLRKICEMMLDSETSCTVYCGDLYDMLYPRVTSDSLGAYLAMENCMNC